MQKHAASTPGREADGPERKVLQKVAKVAKGTRRGGETQAGRDELEALLRVSVYPQIGTRFTQIETGEGMLAVGGGRWRSDFMVVTR